MSAAIFNLNGVTLKTIKNRQTRKLQHIGPKMKTSFIIIWSHLMFLTWLMLQSKMPIFCQAISLIITIISIYLHIVLMQDYFYLKTHSRTSKFRKDIRLIEPILPEKFKRK